MDEIDVKILKLLQKNARITISEMSSEICMSMPAVSERLKKLESSGIIDKYTTILNPNMLKKQLTALMFVGIEKPRYNNAFSEFVKGEKEILECFYITGDFDYILKIATENTATLEKVLNKVKNNAGVQKTKTLIVLSTVTNNQSVTPD